MISSAPTRRGGARGHHSGAGRHTPREYREFPPPAPCDGSEAGAILPLAPGAGTQRALLPEARQVPGAVCQPRFPVPSRFFSGIVFDLVFGSPDRDSPVAPTLEAVPLTHKG